MRSHYQTSKITLLSDKFATWIAKIVGLFCLFCIIWLTFFLLKTAFPLTQKVEFSEFISFGNSGGNTYAIIHDAENQATFKLEEAPKGSCFANFHQVQEKESVQKSLHFLIERETIKVQQSESKSGTHDLLRCYPLRGNSFLIVEKGSSPKVYFGSLEINLRSNPQDPSKLQPQAEVRTKAVFDFKNRPIDQFTRIWEGQALIIPPQAQAAETFTAIEWNDNFSVRGALWIPEYNLPAEETLNGSQNVFWLNNETFVRVLSDGKIRIFSVKQKKLQFEREVQLDTGASIVSSALIFGGNTFVVATQSGQCRSFDLSLAKSNAGSYAAFPSSWILEKCFEKLIAPIQSHAQHRVVMIADETSVMTINTTTGKILSVQKWKELNPKHIAKQNVQSISWAQDSSLWSLNQGQLLRSSFFAPHTDASWRSFFLPQKYEGYSDKEFVWQSSSGSEDFEAKLSLIPLIWGTLKATFYAFIFAVPIAIFAAIYSSEFLERKTRRVIKPAIELMAAIPSVVLGFIAAIVIAPWMEENILSVLICGMLTPLLLYFFGTLLSRTSFVHLERYGMYTSRRLLTWFLCAFLGSISLSYGLGHLIERTLFGGEFKAYLSGGRGTEGVFWGILLFPIVAIGLWTISGILEFSRKVKLGVFFLSPVVAFAIGIGLVAKVTEVQTWFGSYAQRNALVIAVSMGFAIIPIVYSLAEDALSAVPNTLRAASLACGASVWQTAIRVVFPAAGSGIFSAIMIGMGRAIGETMIVVMATGNTPVLNVNPFDGLRSLAANIAVELPEAPKDSTLYRTLFLCALLLFGFTFFINTIAEILRSKYRESKKAL